MAGSLKPNLGGGVLAHNTSLPELKITVNSDPFVVQHVVSAEIMEIAVSRARCAAKLPA